MQRLPYAGVKQGARRAKAVNRRLGVASVAFAALSLVSCSTAPVSRSAAPSQPEAATGYRTGLSSALASRQMAAAANPLAASAGREILRAGGSALDAAIAMQLVLTLVEPQSSGIGGGAFLMHWDGRTVEAFDGRETAPMAANDALFLDADNRPLDFYRAVVGGRSVGVPGVVRMLADAHRRHGKLPWARLFTPAIDLATAGFAISPRLHALLDEDRFLRDDPRARAYFYRDDGAPKPTGSIVKNPALATTLRAIADGGADAFYRGRIAADIVAAVRGHANNPGLLTADDLARYESKRRAPVCTDYRRWRVCGAPPPSSGGIAVAQMLGIFSVRNISVVPPVGAGAQLVPPPDAVHLFSEAGRLAFADRAQYVADPDFVTVDVDGLTDPAYLAARARGITDRSSGRVPAGAPRGAVVGLAPDPSADRISTSHISVVDAAGHAVAMTASIEDAFGARLMVDGFLLNNQLTDFSFLPRAADAGGRADPNAPLIANRVAAGKRPRSAMAPTLVFERGEERREGQRDDELELVATLGSPGGAQIINYVAKTLVGILDWKLDIQQAIALPNFGSRNGPTEIESDRFPSATIDALRARGHEVIAQPMTSGVQGIVRVPTADGARSAWAGGADPRREGVALGD